MSGEAESMACSIIIAKALGVEWDYLFGILESHGNTISTEDLSRIYPLLDRMRPNISASTFGSVVPVDYSKPLYENSAALLSEFMSKNINCRLEKIRTEKGIHYQITMIDDTVKWLNPNAIGKKCGEELFRESIDRTKELTNKFAK